jgi:hypothetical protein
MSLRRIFTLSLLVLVLGSIPVLPQTGESCSTLLNPTSGKRMTQSGSGRRHFCPYSAARELVAAAETEEASAARVARALTKNKSDRTWEYVKVTSGTVPGLIADTGMLDFANSHDVNFLFYPHSDPRIGTKTLWGHAFNKNELIHARGNLEKEGVSNLDKISGDLRNKDFVLVEYSGKGFRADEATWTNTLFMHSSDRPSVLNFDRMKIIAEQVQQSLPLGRTSLDGTSRILIGTIKNPNNEEIVIIFDLDRSNAERRLIGEIHTVSKNPIEHKKAITQRLKSLRPGGRIYIYGDDLRSIDFAQLAATAKRDLIRRSISTVKDFRLTDARLNEIAQRPLEPPTTLLVHGTPSSEAELESMGFPSASLPGWKRVREQIENRIQGKFERRIETKEELIKELSEGNSDVLFVVAHSDGKSIYLGGQKLTIAELEKMPPRNISLDRPRVAVVISCFAGKFPYHPSRWRFFQKEVKSLAEVLVNKGYFDEVLAPSKEITGDESLGIIDSAMTEFSISLGRQVNGLWRIATKKQPNVKEGL